MEETEGKRQRQLQCWSLMDLGTEHPLGKTFGDYPCPTQPGTHPGSRGHHQGIRLHSYHFLLHSREAR